MKTSDGADDKFYTRPEVAAFLVKLIPEIETYQDIVEPSAGSGAFLNVLPAYAQGYDISPEAAGIETADWLKTEYRPTQGLLVGNPPFGKRSALAKAFIAHGVRLGFETIAFILPATFRKLSMQKVFPEDWQLVVDADLPDDVFIHPDGEIKIPCVFQIWTQRLHAVNLRRVEAAQPAAFSFLPRLSPDADLCLNGNSGRVRRPQDVTNPKAEHYLKINGDRTEVEARLRALDLTFHSSVSGGVSWVSKTEIRDAWWRSEEQGL